MVIAYPSEALDAFETRYWLISILDTWAWIGSLVAGGYLTGAGGKIGLRSPTELDPELGWAWDDGTSISGAELVP